MAIQLRRTGLVELAAPEHEPKTTTGQLVIIRSVGLGAVFAHTSGSLGGAFQREVSAESIGKWHRVNTVGNTVVPYGGCDVPFLLDLPAFGVVFLTCFVLATVVAWTIDHVVGVLSIIPRALLVHLLPRLAIASRTGVGFRVFSEVPSEVVANKTNVHFGSYLVPFLLDLPAFGVVFLTCFVLARVVALTIDHVVGVLSIAPPALPVQILPRLI